MNLCDRGWQSYQGSRIHPSGAVADRSEVSFGRFVIRRVT